MKQKQKNNVNKWSVNWSAKQCMQKVEITLQLLLEFCGMPDPKLLVCSLKCQSFRHSFQACKFTYFSKFTSIIACYFGSTAQYEMTSSSVWVWLHNNFILHQHQNRILCVNDAKMWPRLNTNPFRFWSYFLSLALCATYFFFNHCG